MAKILVIDDEPDIRFLLDCLLRQKGYEVVLADSGQKGVELFRRQRPDVMVIDLNMPGMDGLSVLQEVRSLSPHQPVVIFTGAKTPQAQQQARALGVTEFVEKGFSLHPLLEAISRLLNNPAVTT